MSPWSDGHFWRTRSPGTTGFGRNFAKATEAAQIVAQTIATWSLEEIGGLSLKMQRGNNRWNEP